MSNPSKTKGTAAESAVVNYLRSRGYPHVERRALSGALDKGDIAGIAGVVIECKDTKADSWGSHLTEAVKEQGNAGARVGLLVRKRARKSNPAEWYAVCTLEQMVTLLQEAGY
jgi:hypothetical protein